MNYTPQELMVAAAARQIEDHNRVFVGMRLPLLAFQLAKVTHAPRAVSLFENGLLREAPASDMIYTMGDLPNQTDASWATTLIEVMAMMQRGEVDVGFLGGAQVDRFGNLTPPGQGTTNAACACRAVAGPATSRRCPNA